ncbi:mandelate racemase/muconate lactonizing enzyme family protein [Limobrevibacterium gyesilva]|uniref:Mandelate racemase/muconate lactonizing enzyme family protein n=1 Tax=Limobrevibacterium gyesilva TaxID=2991712 RepID=A0AA41YQ51_9PROT|nr:mandelate racemase/muconate lactonizing enzyme family protein [Limobrevibacterium gyesilva]MCW3474578.1 mandelate racemase/muconate lactonizing enzyme family protein [Limobrevibacterium gyesilva]
MKIVDVECYVLLAPNMSTGSTSSAQDSFIVIVRTDEGIAGIGESDVNPWIAKACVEAPGTHTMGLGMRELLIGADPLRIEELWQRIYVGTCMNGRRGAVIHALGAIDMALWDIRGKSEGKPIFELLGGARQDFVVPYASLQPAGRQWEAYRDSLCEWAERAKQLGFRAVKAEVSMSGPYAHDGMHEEADKHTRVVEAVRKTLGPDIALMIDVQYMWPDAATALRTVRDWAAFDIFFLETPIWIDRLDEYARLHDEAPMRIAAGEWQATRWEFEDLLDRGRIDVAQPDIGRVGGFGEAKAVCDMAAARDRLIVPHCWKTGVSVTATAHLAFNTPHCKFIEYLPPELCTETLRRELAVDDFDFVDGLIHKPGKPGLGAELNEDALVRYRVA